MVTAIHFYSADLVVPAPIDNHAWSEESTGAIGWVKQANPSVTPSLYLTPMLIGTPTTSKLLSTSLDDMQDDFGRGTLDNQSGQKIRVGFSVAVSYMNHVNNSFPYAFDNGNNSIIEALTEAQARQMPVVFNLNGHRWQEVVNPCGIAVGGYSPLCSTTLADLLTQDNNSVMWDSTGMPITQIPEPYPPFSPEQMSNLSQTAFNTLQSMFPITEWKFPTNLLDLFNDPNLAPHYDNRVGSYLFSLNEYAGGGDAGTDPTHSYRYAKKSNLQAAAKQINDWMVANPQDAGLVLGVTIDSEISLCSVSAGSGLAYDYSPLTLVQFRYFLAGNTLQNQALSSPEGAALDNPYVNRTCPAGSSSATTPFCGCPSNATVVCGKWGDAVALNKTITALNARWGTNYATTNDSSWNAVFPPFPPNDNPANLSPGTPQWQAAVDWQTFKMQLVANMMFDSLKWVQQVMPNLLAKQIFTHQPDPASGFLDPGTSVRASDYSYCGTPPENYISGYGLGITTYNTDIDQNSSQNPKFCSIDTKTNSAWGIFEWNPQTASYAASDIQNKLGEVLANNGQIIVPNYYYKTPTTDVTDIAAIPIATPTPSASPSPDPTPNPYTIPAIRSFIFAPPVVQKNCPPSP